jgi:hypothetical protein
MLDVGGEPRVRGSRQVADREPRQILAARAAGLRHLRSVLGSCEHHYSKRPAVTWVFPIDTAARIRHTEGGSPPAAASLP